ncbi:MAG: hypothetical protein JNN08_07880 [Bryobacterales bacterium]|nr:hypothetical protein [Bryobacterales bacterium]
MKFAVAGLVVCLLAGLPAAAQKGKTKKGAPEVQIVSLKVQRDGGTVALEGRVKNVSEKPLRGLVIFFEFLQFDGRMISRMTTQVSEDVMGPGEEGEFTTQTPDQVRAVHVRLDAEDTQGRYLKVDKPGPHVID